MAGEQNKPGAQPHHHAHIGTADQGAPIGQIITVGLIVAVLGGGGLWYLNRKGEDNRLNTLFKSSEVRHIGTSNGQRGEVTLSDGSTLKIGPATQLTIIPNYNENFRGIMVDGTIAMDVKASPGTPIEIRGGGGAMVLDEGSVVVRSYGDEGDATFKVISGKAVIRAKEARREVTGPVTLYVSKDSVLSDANPAKADLATSWATGKVEIKDTPLKEVLVLFNKYYALNLKVADDALLTRSVTMEADLDSKQKAIDALQAAAFVKFGYDGSTPILRDDPAAAAKAAKAKK
ncbi:MAG: FecR domain-containing protein [Gemmatimonadaceae bacterium]|nr:FecR domain-containing protein [Gemmatimonadaceae bacterium]